MTDVAAGQSLWADAFRRLSKNRMALVGLFVVLFMGAVALLAPWILPFDPASNELQFQYLPPGASHETAEGDHHRHWLGTDDLGRDILSRTIYGGRISLMVGVVATIVSLLIGVVYGAASGYFGGRIDDWMMRIVDILYALPYIFLVIILLALFGRDLFILFVSLGAVQWLTMARIVRGQVLSLKQKEFVEAARACGAGHGYLIFVHLIPNTLGSVVVYTTLTVPSVILQEAFLSFLGLTVQYEGRNLESWGALAKQGMDLVQGGGTERMWLLLSSAACLSVTLFSLNFLGDGLRDALDPKLRGRT